MKIQSRLTATEYRRSVGRHFRSSQHGYQKKKKKPTTKQTHTGDNETSHTDGWKPSEHTLAGFHFSSLRQCGCGWQTIRVIVECKISRITATTGNLQSVVSRTINKTAQLVPIFCVAISIRGFRPDRRTVTHKSSCPCWTQIRDFGTVVRHRPRNVA